MNRSKIREEVFKLLFRVEFVEKEEMEEQAQLFFEDEENATEENQAEIKAKVDAIVANLDSIDAKINEKISGWDTGRIGKVELTILRLAVYEIDKDDNVPTSVAINEAVELAKKFGQDESAGFVNGVLAKFAK